MSEKIRLKELRICEKFMEEGKYSAELSFTVNGSELRFQLGTEDVKGIVTAAGKVLSEAAVKATNIMNDSITDSLALEMLGKEEVLKEEGVECK